MSLRRPFRKRIRSSAAPAIVIGTLLVVLGSVTAILLVRDQLPRPIGPRDVCMVRNGLKHGGPIAVPYAGHTYYVSCPVCRARFLEQPESYAHAIDPVTGASVDKASAPVVAYQGRAYFFSSEQSRDAFVASPQLRARR